MNAALNYARMPGPGDLWQPPEDPAFARDDAIINVAADLAKEDEVAELVMHVANAKALLAWISTETVIPRHLRDEWAALERQSIALDQRINREFAALNGEEA